MEMVKKEENLKKFELLTKLNKLSEIHCLFIIFWAVPYASSQWYMTGTPGSGQEHPMQSPLLTPLYIQEKQVYLKLSDGRAPYLICERFSFKLIVMS